MIRLSAREPLQPSDDRLYARYFGSNKEIQVRDKMGVDGSGVEKSEDGRQRIIYDPYKFVATIDLKEKTGYIDDIHVHPKYRRQGIAKSFIDSFTQLCKQYGVTQINGIPYSTSKDFWRGQGFDVVQHKKKYQDYAYDYLHKNI